MYFNEKEDTNIDWELKKNRQKKDKKQVAKKIFKTLAIIIVLIILALIAILIIKKINRSYLILNGNTEMTIYKGTIYNEPGYEAYDSKKNSLNDQVTVKSDLDSNTIGTYTIVYTLNGKSKTRTVKVIEKPAIVTTIHLNGKANIYLNVGEAYREPGYVAIDNIDGDLTDKVEVNSNVDTSKRGTYRIIYSVTNSDGVTTSATRTIIVQ